jgi:Flp pilus assembly pilin Flp
MESIKRFMLDETATAEATSTVIMVAAVGLLLGAGLVAYYGGITGFFNSAATQFNGAGTGWDIPGK